MACRSIVDIQADLDAVNAAILKTLLAQKYELDTGQTKQRVERASFKDLSAYKWSLESELSVCTAANDGSQLGRGTTC